MVASFPLIAQFWLDRYQVEGRLSTSEMGTAECYRFHVAGEDFAPVGHLRISQVEEVRDASENIFTLLTVQDNGHILLPSPHTVTQGLYAPVWRLPSQEIVSWILSYFSTAGSQCMLPEMMPPSAWENSTTIMQHLCEQRDW